MPDLTVKTEVEREQGQWIVYLLVIDPEGVERRRLSAHRNERLARLAASSAERGANRRRRPPTETYPPGP